MGAVVVADLVEIGQPDCFVLASPNRNAKVLSKSEALLIRSAFLRVVLRHIQKLA